MRRASALAPVCLILSSLFLPHTHAQTAAPVAAASRIAGPLVLRGVLGGDQIQVNLHPKAEGGHGYEGDYFVFGSSLKVMLAGELDGESLLMEESENGTDISGQWDGRVSGDTISGTWQSSDGGSKKPFTLKALRGGAKNRPVTAK